MTTLSYALPSFDEAEPLGPGDEEFVQEFHQLLKQHGNVNRFGLTLLHDHFHVAPDEILLESNDHEGRTLQLEVVKRSDLTDIKFTSWRIAGDDAEALTACAQDHCKTVALTACAQDKCKTVALTACAQDKCK